MVIALLASAQFASAASYSLVPSSHPVYNNDGTVIIGYVSNIDWDRAAAEQQARAGQHLPIIQGGQDVTDEAGVVYKNACSQEGLSRHLCVNLVGTKKYRDDMLAMARAIVAGGQEAAFPRFAGWIKLAK